LADDVLCVRQWRRYARLRFTRPFAVNLKRFFALLFDFIFILAMRAAEYSDCAGLRKSLARVLAPARNTPRGLGPSRPTGEKGHDEVGPIRPRHGRLGQQGK
jgi:hypothetical protein